MAEELDSGLFGISLSDSDDAGSGAEPNGDHDRSSRAERKNQTEANYLALKAAYKPKIENGEIWKSIKLPLPDKVAKPDAQEILHAAEELYFFRRYAEAAGFVERVLAPEGNSEGVDQEVRDPLVKCRNKCLRKMGSQPGG